MLGVVIAAGLGSRMAPLTNSRPKCMLEVGGRSLLSWTVENLQRVGCDNIVVITGYMAESVVHPGVTLRHNPAFKDNNILHSFMMARSDFSGPMIASYSDIYVEPFVYDAVVNTPGDIVMAVDQDWRGSYIGRSDHPISEAENVLLDEDRRVVATGKHLDGDAPPKMLCGEFPGLWRMSAEGTRLFTDTFYSLDRDLSREQPFQHAAQWRRAYITDMMQELIDRGNRIDAAVVDRGWVELDTLQDYERLAAIAESQRLWRLTERMAR